MGGCSSSSQTKYTASSDRHSFSPSQTSQGEHHAHEKTVAAAAARTTSTEQTKTSRTSQYALSVPASWRLSQEESREALSVIFNEFNLDVPGHLSREELNILLRVVSKRGGVDLGTPFTDKEVNHVLQAFDEDGNGTVEEIEFVHWIVTGMARTNKERRDFARRTSLAYKLDQFLNAIAVVCVKYYESHRPEGRRKMPGNSSKILTIGSTGLSELAILDCLHAIFEDYDDDGNQCLDVDELKFLITEVTTKGRVTLTSPYTKKDVANILKAFDEDGNGTVDESEFVGWIMEGMKKSHKDRRTFAKTGSLASKLDNFLTAITHVCQDVHEQRETILLGDSGFNENEIRGALHALFDEFARKKNGCLSLSELRDMMNAVGVRTANKVIEKIGKKSIEFTENEVVQVNGVFDEDGNGLIEERELVNWMVSGVKRTKEERAAFAETSELAWKLNIFLDCALFIVEDWHDSHNQDHASRMMHRSERGGMNGMKEVHQVGLGETGHMDTWDETFNEMEYSMKSTSGVTAKELAYELENMALNFESRIENIESRIRKEIKEEMKEEMMESISSSISLPTPVVEDQASKERIRFLESRVELLCTKLGIEEEEDNQLENTVPYLPKKLLSRDRKSPRENRRRRKKSIRQEREKDDGSSSETVAQDLHTMTLHDMVSSSEEEEEDMPADSGDESHHYIIHMDDMEF